MKQGGHRKVSGKFWGKAAEGGFTIVETLIVLAVSGSLFVSAVVLISGRQGKTEFSTAINSLQQQLQQVVNETASGYYPNRGDFTCSGSGGALSFTGVSSGQGTNGGCIFLGNAVQVGLGSGKESQLGLLPLVGLQYQTGTLSAVQNISQTKLRAVYPASPTETGFNATTVDQMQYGLAPAASNRSADCGGGAGVPGGMCYVKSGVPARTGVMAFVSGDATGSIVATNGNGDLAGSQVFSLYAVTYNAGGNTGGTNEDLMTASKAIGNNAVVGSSGLVSVDKVSICVASATTDQSGLLTIDSGLHVNLQIKSGTVCA